MNVVCVSVCVTNTCTLSNYKKQEAIFYLVIIDRSSFFRSPSLLVLAPHIHYAYKELVISRILSLPRNPQDRQAARLIGDWFRTTFHELALALDGGGSGSSSHWKCVGDGGARNMITEIHLAQDLLRMINKITLTKGVNECWCVCVVYKLVDTTRRGRDFILAL